MRTKSHSAVLAPVFGVFPRICTLMSVLCLGAILLVALWLVLLMIPTLQSGQAVSCTMDGRPCGGGGAIQAAGWTLAALGMAIYLGPLVFGLYSAHRCFRGLARGEYFKPATVRAFRNFGLGVLVHKVLGFVGPLILVRPASPPATQDGQFGIVLRMGGDPLFSEQILTVLLLGAVVVIAHVLSRAAKLAEENEQFV